MNQISILEKLLILYAKRFPLEKGKLRVVNSLWKWIIGDSGTSRMVVLKHNKLRMQCDLREALQRQYYFFGSYYLETHILDVWERLAREAGAVFDIGANAGIYSLAAISAQPQVTVHAFEPTPEIAEWLRRTAAMNNLERLHVHEIAVLDRTGFATLKRFRGEYDDNEGMNYVMTETPAAGEDTVNTVSLDEFCTEQKIKSIDLLKIDVQGHENTVLKGAANLLAHGRIGTIFMELNWTDRDTADSPAASAIKLLEDAGYQFAIPGRHLVWRGSGEWMRDVTDIISVRIN